jgi:uncharacterized membrane protein required for colicin V production
VPLLISQVGATLSIAAGVFMAILFFVELWAFLSTTIETGVMLDTNAETLYHVRCVQLKRCMTSEATY